MSDIDPSTTEPTTTEVSATEAGQQTEPQRSDPPAQTFTQAQVEAMIQERVAKTRANAEKRISELLGERSEEDLKALVEAHDAMVEAEKSEAQKAIEAAERQAQEAQVERAAAAAERTRYQLLEALTAPGQDEDGKPLPVVDPQYRETVVKLAMNHIATAETDNPIAEAVARVRVEAAPMFLPENPGTDSKQPKSAPLPNRTHGETTGGSKDSDVIAAYKARQGIA